jgi:NADPH-dependent 2,4-dienoyl-CoA reductase/sulfur reductase-like enzyme
LRDEDYLKKTLQVDVKLGVSVTCVSTKDKKVTLSGGASVEYEYLVVATGADPRRIPL